MANVGATIRDATVADVPAMSALMRRAVTTSNVGDYSPDVIAHLVEEFAPAKVEQRMSGRDVFVSCDHDEIQGTVSFARETGKLHSMFVDPDHQKQGIGRDLVTHLEQRARDKGYREVVLSSSLTARSFYEKLGYATLTYEDKPGAATWLMKKRIADA